MNVKISTLLPITQNLSRMVWHKPCNFFFLLETENSAAIFFPPSLLWLITGNLCLRPISNVHLILRISLLNWSDQRVLQNWCQSLKRQCTGACWVSTGRCTGIKWKAPPGITYRCSPEAACLTHTEQRDSGATLRSTSFFSVSHSGHALRTH